jgi:hypothetical protein
MADMLPGFVVQISAPRFAFGYMTVIGRRVKVRRRDWLAAVAMPAGIGVFLRLALPSGGRLHAPGSSRPLAAWPPSGSRLALAVAFGPDHRLGASRSRRTAVPGAATGISWGLWPR